MGPPYDYNYVDSVCEYCGVITRLKNMYRHLRAVHGKLTANCFKIRPTGGQHRQPHCNRKSFSSSPEKKMPPKPLALLTRNRKPTSLFASAPVKFKSNVSKPIIKKNSGAPVAAGIGQRRRCSWCDYAIESANDYANHVGLTHAVITFRHGTKCYGCPIDGCKYISNPALYHIKRHFAGVHLRVPKNMIKFGAFMQPKTSSSFHSSSVQKKKKLFFSSPSSTCSSGGGLGKAKPISPFALANAARHFSRAVTVSAAASSRDRSDGDYEDNDGDDDDSDNTDDNESLASSSASALPFDEDDSDSGGDSPIKMKTKKVILRRSSSALRKNPAHVAQRKTRAAIRKKLVEAQKTGNELVDRINAIYEEARHLPVQLELPPKKTVIVGNGGTPKTAVVPAVGATEQQCGGGGVVAEPIDVGFSGDEETAPLDQFKVFRCPVQNCPYFTVNIKRYDIHMAGSNHGNNISNLKLWKISVDPKSPGSPMKKLVAQAPAGQGMLRPCVVNAAPDAASSIED